MPSPATTDPWRPRGALFDMDGLLLDTERLHLDVGRELGREFGLGELGPVLESMIGVRMLEARALLVPALGDAVTLADFESAWDERVEAELRRNVPVKPGARELLERLCEIGLPCAVATSSRTASAEMLLRGAGLLDLVRTVTGGDRVVNAKPDPEIYHRAAATLGIEARDAVAFEDSDPGTRAAVASGARTVQVPDIRAPSEAVRALGHTVAPDLLAGAGAVGLPVG